MLRIASIGCDAELVELLRAAQRSPHISLVAGYGCHGESAAAAELRQIMRSQKSAEGNDWEELLSLTIADVVLFGQVDNEPQSGTDRDEMLRRLVQAMVPLVVIHPPCDMLLAYELQMIRHDSLTPVFPYVPWIQHSAVKRAVERLKHSATDIQQLVFERFADVTERTQSHVVAQVARDALVLRRMMGDVKSVSATAGAVDRNPYGNLSVHLMGEDDSGLVARWSIGPRSTGPATNGPASVGSASVSPPSVQQPGDFGSDTTEKVNELAARLTLVTDERSGVVELYSDQQSARCQLPGRNESAVEATEPLADQFLADVVASVRDGADWSGITWEEACRSLEITDALERSLKRRRTIELYHEQVTEHDTFKSVMAAGGCGMLLWVMLLLMIAGVVEGLQLPIRDTFLWRLWPLALIAPLAVFLGLQLLQLVFKRTDVPPPASPTTNDAS